MAKNKTKATGASVAEYLAARGNAQQREQAELREYAARPDATPATPLGSLADKLRDALRRS